MNSVTSITHLQIGLDVLHLRNTCHVGRMITRQKDWPQQVVPEKWKLYFPRRCNGILGLE